MIYRPSSESRSILGIEYPYQWIVCVPIVTHARQPIGVVSMSGGPPETDAEFLMATLAERARKGTLNDELTQVQNSLVAAVNYGFWHTLARTPLGEQSPPFPEYLRRRAEQEGSWVDADFSERDDTDAR